MFIVMFIAMMGAWVVGLEIFHAGAAVHTFAVAAVVAFLLHFMQTVPSPARH